MVVAEGDRPLGTVVDDTTIKINISSNLLSSSTDLFVNVNTSVIEGRVLLTGIVQEQETRIEAVRRVWEVSGVKEVIKYLLVGQSVWQLAFTPDQKTLLSTNLNTIMSLTENYRVLKTEVF